MKGSWQGTLLVTDEPSSFKDQKGQVYVLHVQPNGAIRAYCITKLILKPGTEDEFVRKSDIFKNLTDRFTVKGSDPLISAGGEHESEELFLIYDASKCWTEKSIDYESSKTISEDILCVAKFKDAFDHLLSTSKWPAFETIVKGYTEFTNEEITTKVSSGKWQSRSLLAYPFVVYADELEFKAEIAKNVLRSYDGNIFSMMSHMLPIMDELKIAGIKYAAWEKAGKDTTPDELKEITRMMLYLEASKEGKFFDIQHGEWQEQLAEFRKLNIGGTEFDGLKKKPIVERYEELEAAYSKLGFDPQMMELGLLMKAAAKNKKPDQIQKGNEDRDPTKWGKALDMIKAVVKGRTSDPD